MTLLRFLGLAAAATTALSLAACSTGPVDGTGQSDALVHGTVTDSFPVTIEHALGTTTIDEAPTRVATIDWVNADIAMALGVVPVGMIKDEWGGNEHGTTPWKDAALEKLGAEIGSDSAPVLHSELDGIPFDEIAQLDPDVILAVYSGLSPEDYATLSKIAPVVAYPEVAYTASWQESTLMIGSALGMSAAAEKLIDDTENALQEKAAEYPQLKGATFIYGHMDPTTGDGISLYTAADNAPRFLTSLGMTLAPVVVDASKGSEDYYVTYSNERANELESDVFITWVDSPQELEAIRNDPLLSQVAAVRNDSLIADSTHTLILALAAASPLSLPWAADELLPQLADAVDRLNAAK